MLFRKIKRSSLFEAERIFIMDIMLKP